MQILLLGERFANRSHPATRSPLMHSLRGRCNAAFPACLCAAVLTFSLCFLCGGAGANVNAADGLPPILLHLHIPKTGGAFLRAHMEQSLRDRRQTLFAYGLRGAGSFLDLAEDAQMLAGGVHGHFGYGMHLRPGWKLTNLRRPLYTTVLRDPVERTISQFQVRTTSCEKRAA